MSRSLSVRQYINSENCDYVIRLKSNVQHTCMEKYARIGAAMTYCATDMSAITTYCHAGRLDLIG